MEKLKREEYKENPGKKRSQYSVLLLHAASERYDECTHILKDYFEVCTASSIAQATEVLSESDVDVLIACINSPGVDLFTFFRTLKNNITTHDLGLIVLSESLTTEKQIYAYESGADALLEIPVQKKLMLALINNLIRKAKLKTEILSAADHSCVHLPLKKHLTENETLLSKAAEVIVSNINDPAFDFDHFAEEMQISKSTLHRKIKEQTNLSPVLFIRNVRLKHAYGLLVNTSDKVSNIATAVGYEDPKYFSKSFKALYGKSPREFRQAVAKGNLFGVVG